jgi:deoxyuridine 5'-triphosphate nucleotidohydrolase
MLSCPRGSGAEPGNGLVIDFVKLDKLAKVPIRGSEDAAAFDLYSVQHVHVPANGKALIKTGLQVQIPKHYCGRIVARSKLAWHSHLVVGGGVIDADYRGEVLVILFNLGKHDCFITPADACAQMLVHYCPSVSWSEKEQLEPTKRGSKGVKSTCVVE